MGSDETIDVIVCAKNARGTLALCLGALLKQKGLGKIIVVHPYDDQLTPFIARNFLKTVVVHEALTSCLAYARKQGACFSSASWVTYVDADVILGKNHLWALYQTAKALNVKPIAVEGILQKKTLRKSILSSEQLYQTKCFVKGERGFTHNTLFNREILDSWLPPWTYAWEDYHLTQHVLKNGGVWVRTHTPYRGLNLQDYDLFHRGAWSSAGERVVKQLGYITMVQSIFISFGAAIKSLVIRRNIRLFLEQITIGLAKLSGYFAWTKYFVLQVQRE